MMRWKLIAAALAVPLLATGAPWPAEGQPPEEMVTITIKTDGEVTIARPMVAPPPPADKEITITLHANGTVTVDKPKVTDLTWKNTIKWQIDNLTGEAKRVSVANFKWLGRDSNGADHCVAPQPGTGEEAHFRDPLLMHTPDHENVQVIVAGVRKKMKQYTGCYKYGILVNGKELLDPELEFDSDDGEPPPPGP